MLRFFRTRPKVDVDPEPDIFAAKDAQRDRHVHSRVYYQRPPIYADTIVARDFVPERPPYDQDAADTARVEAEHRARPLTGDIDALLAETDLLALPIVTGTLVGRREVAG